MNIDRYVVFDVLFILLNVVVILLLLTGFAVLIIAAIRYLKRTKK